MAVNLAVVAIAVPAGAAPLFANFFGFVLSFAWCFFGHARWTFPAADRDARIALWRFAALSLLSFGLTQAVYAGVLASTRVDYRLSLFLVIQTVAIAKLLASKYWAFARSQA